MNVYALFKLNKLKNIPLKLNGDFSRTEKNQNEPRLRPEGVLLLSAFWGRDSSKMLKNTCLPSLTRSGIFLPSFSMPIELVVFCPREEWLYISESVTKDLFDHGATVRWVEWTSKVLSPDIDKNKERIFDFLSSQIKFAESKNLAVVFAFPDLVFGRGLEKVIFSMNNGDYVVCAQARVDQANIDKIELMISNGIYSNRELVNLACNDFSHQCLSDAFYNPNSYSRAFREAGCINYFFKEPPPLAIYGGSEVFEKFARVQRRSLQFVDHEIPDIFFSKGSLRVVESSETFFWMELTPSDVYHERIRNSYWSRCAIYLNQFAVKWHY